MAVLRLDVVRQISWRTAQYQVSRRSKLDPCFSARVETQSRKLTTRKHRSCVKGDTVIVLSLARDVSPRLGQVQRSRGDSRSRSPCRTCLISPHARGDGKMGVDCLRASLLKLFRSEYCLYFARRPARCRRSLLKIFSHPPTPAMAISFVASARLITVSR